MRNSVEIRRSRLGDRESLFRIHMDALRKTCAQIYSHEQVEAICRGKTTSGYARVIQVEGDDTIYVACHEGDIRAWMHARRGEILGLFTDPKFSRQGYGTALAVYAREHLADRDGTIVLESTLNAVGFYRRQGFLPVSGCNTVRSDLEIPVVLMRLSLPSD